MSVKAQDKFRTERDLLGEKEVPADAYYGVQTARALENFKISEVAINHYPGFVEAWAIVKLAAARANTDQGGAGTSTNMNANEVLANIALELSGHKKGEYQFIDPHDD